MFWGARRRLHRKARNTRARARAQREREREKEKECARDDDEEESVRVVCNDALSRRTDIIEWEWRTMRVARAVPLCDDDEAATEKPALARALSE